MLLRIHDGAIRQQCEVRCRDLEIRSERALPPVVEKAVEDGSGGLSARP